MKVKELVDILSKMNQDSEVHLEYEHDGELYLVYTRSCKQDIGFHNENCVLISTEFPVDF